MARDDSDNLVAYLRQEFDTSNITVSFSPGDSNDTTQDGDVDHANYDDGPDYPSAVVVTEDPTPIGAGPMGVTGMDPGGAGSTQRVVVSLLVDCWGGTWETADTNNWSISADEVAKEIAWEVHRILFETQPTNAPNDYELVSADVPRSAHDTQASPTVRRYQTVAYLAYTNYP